jgi:hypothetical protein
VCVANIGDHDATAVDVTFALAQVGADITSLRAPSSPGEVSNTQARAIIGSIPPRYQTQLEIAVRSQQPLEQVRVAVPKAYRLTETDPVLQCNAQGGSGPLPELTSARFTIGGQAIAVEDVAQVLLKTGAVPANMAYLSGVSITASSLFVVLGVTLLFIVGLVALAFFVLRR